MTLEAFPPPLLAPLVESPHVVGAFGEPAFAGAWVNYASSPYVQPAQFWRDSSGLVHLSGLVRAGAIGTIFTLPVGYRPLVGQPIFIVDAGPGVARIDVTPDGQVQVNTYKSGGTNANVSLDEISFQATPPPSQTLYDPSAVAFEGATPPVNPNHGTRWIRPVDQATYVNPGGGTNVGTGLLRWEFQYNALSPSAYKWEFIGGPDLFASIVAYESDTVAAAYATFGTGPRITTPRAGDYDVLARATSYAPSATQAGAGVALSPGVGSAGPIPSEAVLAASLGRAMLVADLVLAGLAAGVSIETFVFTSISGVQFGERTLRIRPRRVS